VSKARHSKVTVIVVMAALALAGCGGSGGGSDGKTTSSPTPTEQADPYEKAPWRMKVVNLLNALRTPEDGKYRTWMSDDPELWTKSFIYTPRSSGDPGWERRNDGAASVYPGKMNKAEKKAFFNGITRDNTVIASTLTVVDAGGETVAGDNSFKFTFKVKTSDGKWLTGMAIGHGESNAAYGWVTRLTYDVA
jgi:hypothetical protein